MALRRSSQLVLAAMFLLLALTNCPAGFASISRSTPRENMDDRNAVQTALLEFFNAGKWKNMGWSSKGYVVLRTQFASTKRASFSECLLGEIDSLRDQVARARKGNRRDEIADASANLSKLTAIQSQVPAHGRYRPPAVHPIRSYKWDLRILISDKGGSWFHDVEPKAKQDPRFKTVGAFAKVDLPSYSPDGNLCLVEMGLPWSMHVGRCRFLLSRTRHGWQVRYVSSVYVL